MGLIKSIRQDTLAAEARRAREQGHVVFAAMLNVPISQSSANQPSGSVSGWAEIIEGIEAEGWMLTSWAVCQDKAGRPQAYPVFRRAA